MVFGVTKDDSCIGRLVKVIISINDVIESYESSWVELPWDSTSENDKE